MNKSQKEFDIIIFFSNILIWILDARFFPLACIAPGVAISNAINLATLFPIARFLWCSRRRLGGAGLGFGGVCLRGTGALVLDTDRTGDRRRTLG